MDVDLARIIGDGLRAALGPVGAYYALAAMGLNLHFGYTGLLNFGQVGFMLMGAYGLAISVSIWGFPFWAGILVGIGAAIVLALILGMPTLRLRADYLAIATIAASEILRRMFRSGGWTPYTAGSFGIPSHLTGPGYARPFYAANPFPPGTYNVLGASFSHTRLWAALVGWSLVILLTAGIWLLMRSPWGRVIKSIREDEDAARSLGKNVFSYKMQSLILGGVLGGIGGMVMALAQQAVEPNMFRPELTFYAYVVLILGGAASVMGPALGSLLFWFMMISFESFLRQGDLLPTGAAGPLRWATVGVVLVILMVFRPQGILGNRREMMLHG